MIELSTWQKERRMPTIVDAIHIPDAELEWSFVASGGPGGQNVNKVASKAVLRWNVAATLALPPEVKGRFLEQQKNRITVEGDLVLSSQKTRDQAVNRDDCLDKLRAMILQAMARPTVRKKTKPSKASKRRRLADKKHRSDVKSSRRSLGD
jgi:ribosome-associated protein